MLKSMLKPTTVDDFGYCDEFACMDSFRNSSGVQPVVVRRSGGATIDMTNLSQVTSQRIVSGPCTAGEGTRLAACAQGCHSLNLAPSGTIQRPSDLYPLLYEYAESSRVFFLILANQFSVACRA
jgi:hypothetical protein